MDSKGNFAAVGEFQRIREQVTQHLAEAPFIIAYCSGYIRGYGGGKSEVFVFKLDIEYGYQVF